MSGSQAEALEPLEVCGVHSLKDIAVLLQQL